MYPRSQERFYVVLDLVLISRKQREGEKKTKTAIWIDTDCFKVSLRDDSPLNESVIKCGHMQKKKKKLVISSEGLLFGLVQI